MVRIPEISPQEFSLIAAYVRQLSGIDLDGSKAYLVENRLGPLLIAHDCRSYFELYRRMKDDASGRLASLLVDLISTQETSFFRDHAPFELLRHELLPAHIHRIEANGGPRRLDIWSAACSTGQETCSIAMVVRQCLPDPTSWQVRILGTDISVAAVDRARRGLYSQLEVERGLSRSQIECFFTASAEGWQFRQDIRELVSFQPFNLLELTDDWGAFDLIFCRNVAIYFSLENRLCLFERLAHHLRPHGALVLGSTESMVGTSGRFRSQRARGASFYTLGGDPALARTPLTVEQMDEAVRRRFRNRKP